MSFLKYQNETVTYPYSPKVDYPNTAFPTGYDYPDFDIYWVQPTPQINPDPNTLKPVEGTPIFNSATGRWEQTWDYVPLTDEEIRQRKYNPSAFLQQMMASSTFDTWLGNFTALKQTKLITVATNAKMDANWTVMQAVYDSYKAGVAPSAEAIAEWTIWATDYGIPLTF